MRKSLIIYSICVPLAMGCTSSSKDLNEDLSDSNDVALDDGLKSIENRKLKAGIFDVIDKFPPPSLVPLMLEAPGKYNDDLRNSPKHVEKYFAHDYKAALNLGAYTADVGYLVSYNKMYDVGEYLLALRELADELNITTAFDIEVMRKVENHMDDRVYILNMIDDEYRGVNKFLRSDYRTREAVMVVTGAFIEGLYISTYYLQNYPEIEGLNELVDDQQESLKEIADMLNTLDNDALDELTAEINKLEVLFPDRQRLVQQTTMIREMIVSR